MDKPILIIKRNSPQAVHMDDGSIKYEEIEPHYELHFDNRVEFWSLDGRKLGESEVHEVK